MAVQINETTAMASDNAVAITAVLETLPLDSFGWVG